ncbi:MAG: glycoside hydrolase domain-containing protein [Verrucomicrobiota bacterium]
MRIHILTAVFCGIVLVAARAAVSGNLDIKKLPEEEQALANTVDPWGLAFSDQLARFQRHFGNSTNVSFVAGYTHSLVKVWRNKYWFRGAEVIAPGAAKETKPLWGTAGSVVSFQVAILPNTGAKACRYQVVAQSPVPTRVFREEFIKLGSAPYPRFESAYWPDPLVLTNDCELSGIWAGVFLVEAAIPADFGQSGFKVEVRVAADGGNQAAFMVPVELVKLKPEPPDFHLVAWFNKGKLSDGRFDAMCDLALEHHLEPLAQSELTALWSTNSPDQFEQRVQSLMKNGQRIFQINKPARALYDFLVKKGWLDRFMIYSNADEPAESTFHAKNIPYAQDMRTNFPGLKIFLASEFYPNMSAGCDIWLTDLSRANYDPRSFVPPVKPQLWHYYCHLPVNWQMRAPLTMAPNMQIDNDALEHRLALWMSWHYKAKGALIWAGNSEWNHLVTNFWSCLDLSGNEYRTSYKFPYGGIHHGNGNLMYPPRTPDGEPIPSLRLKVLRDGMQDIALFESAVREYGSKVQAFVAPVPAVFQHPHYYDRLPETLLNKREALLRRIRELEER